MSRGYWGVMGVAAAVGLLIAGCATSGGFREIGGAGGMNPAQSRIIGYRIEHNAADHLALWIEYYYGGGHGDCVRVGAITKKDGESTGYWTYRPDPVEPGKHWARVLVGINDDAPRVYRSDALQFSMYVCGSAEFLQVTVPFRKTWRRLRKPLACHAQWGAGCH